MHACADVTCHLSSASLDRSLSCSCVACHLAPRSPNVTVTTPIPALRPAQPDATNETFTIPRSADASHPFPGLTRRRSISRRARGPSCAHPPRRQLQRKREESSCTLHTRVEAACKWLLTPKHGLPPLRVPSGVAVPNTTSRLLQAHETRGLGAERTWRVARPAATRSRLGTCDGGSSSSTVSASVREGKQGTKSLHSA